MDARLFIEQTSVWPCIVCTEVVPGRLESEDARVARRHMDCKPHGNAHGRFFPSRRDYC
jgi:hypothetical protein